MSPMITVSIHRMFTHLVSSIDITAFLIWLLLRIVLTSNPKPF
jgi:hypothetical protein